MDPTDFVTSASSLFDRFRGYLSLRSDAEALVRLVAIECRRNLALLSALRLDSLEEQNDPDFLAVADLLETEALESLFAIGPKESKARELLAQRANEIPPNGAEEALPAELLLRIYVRMTAMQKLRRLSRAGQGLREIRWRTRLANVERDLREAAQTLDRVLSERK